jgi:hypothetical protein
MCKGLLEFLTTLSTSRKDIPSAIIDELELFIINSGCQQISFELLPLKALGISIPESCTINLRLLELPPQYILYIILHEISHQYQYSKYGKNLVLDIYNGDLLFDLAVSKLMNLEKTADRLAIMKMNSILKAHNFNLEPVVPRYLNIQDTTYFEKFVSQMREEALSNNCTTIEEMNHLLYKKIS